MTRKACLFENALQMKGLASSGNEGCGKVQHVVSLEKRQPEAGFGPYSH
ncbi:MULTISPECIES: hypothetical protein [unclassified Rhizobium]|nr:MULTISPECIES: hypothetical protein [unclassified Rhizobium]